MLRHLVVILLLCLCLGILSAQTSPGLTLPLPQFSNPFYDSYSRNFTGTAAAGRGYTGAAVLGDVSGVLLNPATVLPDSAQLALEFNIKPPVDAEGYIYSARYTSPVPFGMLALNGRLSNHFGVGIVYSMPKSLKLYDFSVLINQGNDIVQRFPSYNLHQVSANLSYHQGAWHAGLNLHNQIHYIDDPIFMHTYDRISDYRYSLRIQPGWAYSSKHLNLGASLMPATKFTWDQKYTSYDAVLPLWATAGLNLHSPNYSLLIDAEFEQQSAVSDSFNDRLSLKAGVEKRQGRICYRLGYMYIPEVFSGLIRLPENVSASADSSLFWEGVSPTLLIPENSQHFVSLGFSYYHPGGSINAALVQSLASEASKTQVNLSLSLYLNSFKRKGFLYFDE